MRVLTTRETNKLQKVLNGKTIKPDFEGLSDEQAVEVMMIVEDLPRSEAEIRVQQIRTGEYSDLIQVDAPQ